MFLDTIGWNVQFPRDSVGMGRLLPQAPEQTTKLST